MNADGLKRAAKAAHDMQTEIDALGAGPAARKPIRVDEITLETLKGMRTTPDGGLVLTFDALPNVEVSIELTLKQREALADYLRAVRYRFDRYSQAYADSRVINLLVDRERGTAPGGFLTKLIGCIQAADPENRERLRMGFPQFVDAVERWKNGELS